MLAFEVDAVEEGVVDALEVDLTKEDSEPGQHTDSSDEFVMVEKIDEDHGSEVSGDKKFLSWRSWLKWRSSESCHRVCGKH